MTATYASFRPVMMQEQQEQERAEAALRRTPSPEEHAQQQQHQGGRNAGTASLLVLSEADYSPIPGGADASSQSSPGSASDHMGLFPVGSSSGSLGGGGGGGAPMMYPGSAAIAAFDAGQQQRTNRFIPTNITTGTTTSVAAAVGSKFGVAGAIPTPVTSFSSDVAAKCSKSSGATTTGTTTVRRQKRLQRNRESARLSRRRRKQYLEELEERVEKISESLDQTRRKHVGEAVATIHQKRFEILAREGCLNDNNSNNNSATVSALLANLSRTSPELMIATTFQSQQLKSFSAPPDMQFMLWLTLQTEAFFRGGRAASERLSAARIGERMLSSGTEFAAPSQSMWPLFCNEIGLSYDQEEKLRAYQRMLLQEPSSWLDRHTAYASREVMQSSHDTVQALTLRVGQRERTSMSKLSETQRLKLLSWSTLNRDRVAHSTAHIPSTATKTRTRDIDPLNQHIAANLYILNERLQKVLQVVPRAAPLVTGAALKKLSRRPSFEPLGACDEKVDIYMDNTASCSSSNSLKRNASEMSMDDDNSNCHKPQVPAIVPVDAQAASINVVHDTLEIVLDLLPLAPVVTILPQVPSPRKVESNVPTPIPVVSLVYQAPAAFTQSAPTFGALQQHAALHERKSSFLPPHLNVVPEEMWPGDEADEFLLDMIEGDWAIGEGIDMDMLQ